jgi:DNA polymerase-3 subunit beta
MKTELVQAISTVAKAVASKPQMPILSGIYFKAENNQLELQATDYEIGIRCRIDAEIENPGTILISGRYIQDVVRSLPDERVSFTYDKDENIVKINSGSSNFTLLSMAANEFPTVKEVEGNLAFDMTNLQLCSLIRKTAFACAHDDSRPVFTGCYLDVNEAGVTMAATNTHRLSVKTAVIDGIKGSIKIIIPAKVLMELQRIMTSDVPAKVHVIFSYNQASFQYENIFLTSRLIEGQFPDYMRVIPPELATHIKLATKDFLSAVDRVALISRTGDYNIIRLEFSAEQVRILSNNPDIGNAEETIPAAIDGPDITIAFNATYIMDVLKNIDADHFTFALNKPLSSAVIKENDDDMFTYVVTPVRTSH